MPDFVILLIGGILFFICIMLLLLIGAVIYQYFKNKSVNSLKPKPSASKEKWTGWKKLGRSMLVIGLWAGVNYLGWYGLFPEFWEEWYAIGEKFFWTSHVAIISIFLVSIWLRDEANKNKKMVNGIIYALIALLTVSIGIKVTAIADKKGWLPEKVVKTEKKRTSKPSVVRKKSSYTEGGMRRIVVPAEGMRFHTGKKNARYMAILVAQKGKCIWVYTPRKQRLKECYNTRDKTYPKNTYTNGWYAFVPVNQEEVVIDVELYR